MLRASRCPMERLVLVCDNAPCHSGLEEVLDEDELRGVTLLRLGPYSAPLNPIEEVWSVLNFMADLKRRLAATLTNMIETPPCGTTLTEHRMRYLETAIDAAVPSATPMLNTFNHVQRQFAACLALSEFGMGDNVM